jgi:hypothetical protein
MPEPFCDETQRLFDAADRAIARSRELSEERRDIVAECERQRRQRELRQILAPRDGKFG